MQPSSVMQPLTSMGGVISPYLSGHCIGTKIPTIQCSVPAKVNAKSITMMILYVHDVYLVLFTVGI